VSFAVIVIAILAGIAVALQGQFMALTNRAAGTVTAVFITYGVGAAIAAVAWFITRAPRSGSIPAYAWLAGPLGLVIVGGISFAAPRLGLGRTLVITIAAQLAAALLIDQFGFFGAVQRGFDVPRAIGFALTVTGVWLIVR
jgi:transporter family-2 protein